ncbi:MAG: HDIG domain-containing protein [Defluviitaleaceae bacterium]|nr:HDIG domain-containing protein [Defluviitaleaceae bacterium]
MKKGYSNIKSGTFVSFTALIITIIFLISGSYVSEGYNIEPGSVSPVRIRAIRQIENRVLTEQLRDEAESLVQPLFRVEPSIGVEVVQRLDRFFLEIDRLRRENTPFFTPGAQITLPPRLDVISHEEFMRLAIEDSFLIEIEDFNFNDLLFLVNLESELYQDFRDNVYNVVINILDQGVQEDAHTRALLDMRDEFDRIYAGMDPYLSGVAYEISAVYFVPNRIFDEEATLTIIAERRAEISTIYFLPGQTIVDEGAIVTEEAFAAIESLGLLSRGIVESIMPIIGVSGVAIFIFAFILIYIARYCERLLKNRKEALMLLFLYLVTIGISRVLGGTGLWIFIPILPFTLLVAILLDTRLALVLNIGVTVITMLIIGAGLDYMLFFILVGTLTAEMAKYADQRNNVFFLSLIVAAAGAFFYGAITLVFERAFSQGLMLWSAYAFLNGILTVMLAMGSLPLWEAMFGVITQIKLLDLINPDNELLRRLTIEAPATYHHSLIVANLAETAAYDIGANPNIAKVGAYYHDIGKLKYPQYYSENQISENLHDELDPYSSVAVITGHVNIGLLMANEYKLPAVVRDIIAEHHGNSLIKYFYHKAQKEHPEDELDEKDFRYKNLTPQSKESAVVMLADTVEAAVRSMLSASRQVEEIEAFTRSLIKDKLDDGQLIDSGLTIKDLDIIAKAFMRVFKGMYHERIPYPKVERA